MFVSLHHTNNRVENISILYLLLFKSVTKKLFLADKILKRHYRPLTPPSWAHGYDPVRRLPSVSTQAEVTIYTHDKEAVDATTSDT